MSEKEDTVPTEKKKSKKERKAEKKPEKAEAPVVAEPALVRGPSKPALIRSRVRRKRPPQHGLIALSTFLLSQPEKPDQFAAFIRWCRLQGHGKMTRAEWHATLTEFKTTPVGK